MSRITTSGLRLAASMLAVLALVTPALAQTATTGVIEGRVMNASGEPLANAAITAAAARAPVSTTTDAQGRFILVNLPPGTYTVRAEASGFGTVAQEEVNVNISSRTRLDFTLNPGQVEEVTIRGEVPLIDPRSTTTGATFEVDDLVDYVPVSRNFADSFTLAPGVVSGGGTGAGNYSISGSSGLENSYIVDGVNITSTGYGGIGSYNIVYGSLGTGVTYDFLEEIQVKTGGIDVEFGQATGGVINTVVKSGTNNLSGSVGAYFTPAGTTEDFKRTSLTTGAIDIVEREQTDLAASVGGPIAKDKLFYFAAYNPVVTTEDIAVENSTLPAFLSDVGVSTFPASALGSQQRERRSDNWAAKLTYAFTPNHRFELGGFGDPSKGDRGPQNELALKFLDFAQGGGQSEIKYGANNYSLHYDGVFTPQFFLSAQVSRHDGKFEESQTLDQSRLRDRRQQLCFLFGPLFCQADDPLTPENEAQSRDNGALWYYGGTGFVSNAIDVNDQLKLTATYVLGDHEVKGGIQYDDIEYTDDQAYSGPSIDFPIPLSDGSTAVITSTSGALVDRRSATNFRVVRARFYPTPPPTKTEDLNFFLQDTWSVTPRWTAKLGVRVNKQKIAGSGGFSLPFDENRDPGTKTFNASEYTFDTAVAPRLGMTWDIAGDGRSKLYANLGRYFERIPNDLAIRSLSNEVGISRYTFTGFDFAAGVPTGPNSASTILFQGLETTTIEKDTKLPYVDEIVLGYQRELNRDTAIEIRGIYREQGRVLEDVQYTTLESIQNYYYGTNYGYPVDPFPGFGTGTFGAYVLANPGDNSQGNFPKPVREYTAGEFIFNKRFSDNWLFYGNFRISKLIGNYEGLFRNDNGQSDPNITSLFDFPNSPLMEGQFNPGRLNTDRPYTMNLTSSYTWDNGLTVGGRFNWLSGTPRTPLLAHPNYQNSGELPGLDPIYFWFSSNEDPEHPGQCNAQGCFNTGPASEFAIDNGVAPAFITPILYSYDKVGRGALGRLPDTATFDVRVGYDLKLGKSALNLGIDIFNLFDQQEITYMNDNVEATAGVPDPDFNRPLSIPGAQRAYQAPRSVRFMARWNF